MKKSHKLALSAETIRVLTGELGAAHGGRASDTACIGCPSVLVWNCARSEATCLANSNCGCSNE